MTPEERAVIEAAQGVDNCMDAEDHVWLHINGGGCLQVLRDAVDALDVAPIRARMAGPA